MPLKVLYDHQTFSLQKFGGISRYFYEVIKRIVKSENEVEIETSLLISNNYYLYGDLYFNHLRIPSILDIKGVKRMELVINKLVSIMRLKFNKFDVFHPTYYDPFFLKYLNGKPYVITVHDLTHEILKLPSANKKFLGQKRTSIEHASKIIAISESTKKDLIEIYNVDEQKIEVIYHGNSLNVPENIELGPEYPKNFLLFVGARYTYKNFLRLITSLAPVLIENKDLYFICAGGDKFDVSEKELIKKLQISAKVKQYTIDDITLAKLYANAKMFIFPSYYEGFGIPLLEAFACNCPIACSNTSSLPEIAQNAAVYFDPYDENSIKDTITNLLENELIRKELAMKGQDRLKNFSWDKAANKTLDVYKSLID